MVTKVFVTKVSRIKNSKTKDYYIHRINMPTNIVEELKLKDEDYLFLKAKKAEWYHMLNWSEMNETWKRLPKDIQQRIKEDGLLDELPHIADLSVDPQQRIVDATGFESVSQIRKPKEIHNPPISGG